MVKHLKRFLSIMMDEGMNLKNIRQLCFPFDSSGQWFYFMGVLVGFIASAALVCSLNASSCLGDRE